MPNTQHAPARESDVEHIWEQIRQAVGSLKFGTVEITVHDSRVVQLERKEKLRFQQR